MLVGTKSGTTDLTGIGHDHSSGTINTPIRYKLKPQGNYKDSSFYNARSAEGKGRSQTETITQFCNICGRLACETREKRLVRDHNHSTGYIRGMLCDPCNGRLGTFESKKINSKMIMKLRKKSRYKYWVSTYYNRIIFHLSCNTGVRYSWPK